MARGKAPQGPDPTLDAAGLTEVKLAVAAAAGGAAANVTQHLREGVTGIGLEDALAEFRDKAKEALAVYNRERERVRRERQGDVRLRAVCGQCGAEGPPGACTVCMNGVRRIPEAPSVEDQEAAALNATERVRTVRGHGIEE